jgi:prophage maintenance system killer protein
VTDYLGLGDVIALHAEVMGCLGRSPAPLLDEDGLSAELHRPRAAALYEQADLIRQAAILAVHIAHLRPLAAGNLPTAFAATESFLNLNGWSIRPGHSVELAYLLRLLSEEPEAEGATVRFEARLRSVVTDSDLAF